MKTSSPSIITCLVVVVSTLAWIAGVSLALVYFLGLSDATGWWIAGTLGFSSVVAMTVILYELRHAVQVDAVTGGSGLEGLADPVPWSFPGTGSKRYSKV
jgi:hypothetical protein